MGVSLLTYVLLRVIIMKGVVKMPLTSQEMIKLLKKNGFKSVSQNGSHVKMRNMQTGQTIYHSTSCKGFKKGVRTGHS